MVSHFFVLLCMTTEIIFRKISLLARKNNKLITTDAERDILSRFLNCKITDGKDITKLKKIAAKYVKQVIPIQPEHINPELTSRNLTIAKLYLSEDITNWPEPGEDKNEQKLA